MTQTIELNRRSLIKGTAGVFLLAVNVQGLVQAQEPRKYGADSMPNGTVDDPLAFISIAPDGTVTIIAHRAEMGTGVRTSLPMVVADELEATWDRVKIVQGEANEKRYGNQNVDGSRSMRHFLMPMRRAGAAARQMLEAAAAARWGVPVTQVRAQQHEVLHAASGRRFGFGELAAEAMRQPVPSGTALKLKQEKDFRYIGKGAVRATDLENIGKGVATYGMDFRLPGMVYAVMARPPVLGGKIRTFRSEKALQVPGVLKIVEIPVFTGAHVFQSLGGIAVVANNTWAAMQGRAALEIEWDDGPHASYDSAAYRRTLETAARKPGKVLRDQGNVADAWARAAEKDRVSAEYYVPHHAHATMEPPVATALVTVDRCEIWSSVQNPQGALNTVAASLGMKPEQVRLNVLLLGGGFGRKSKPDFAVEAATVARTMPGTPVKLVWTRDDDLRHDYFHAVSLERMESAVDSRGMPTTWLHRTTGPTIGSTFTIGAKGQSASEAAMSANNMPFPIANVRVEAGEVEAHTRIGWFRSVANIQHAFATQCFIAELAARAGKDHKEFALQLIGAPRKINPRSMSDSWNYSESPDRYPYDTGRLRGVIEAATRGARWGRKLPKGRGLGLAFCYSFVSYTATVVEVEVSDKGEIKVIAVDMAMDCGPQINPERIRSQMEGGAIMGLSLATTSEITFEKGSVVQSNFHDFEVLRHHASPRVIRTHLVNNDFRNPPGGVGEPPLPPVAPALCNAIFAATGKRIRELPVRTVA